MGGEQLEWLPVGWKVKVRVRSCGRKDKYYVNPSNGLKFSSKPEVLRYLKSSEKDQKPNELDKIDVKKDVAGKLPPGWVKEIRTKRKGSRIRRDPYYVDPVSGHHFRSMQEVFRYLESKPDDKDHVSVELGDHSQSEKRKTPNSECTHDLPRRASKRLARVEIEHPSPEIKTSDKSGVPDTTSEDKNLDSSLEGLLMDPCIEFAVKTLTGAIPIEEVNKAATSKLPSGHIWADPCFEFAVKMLTGEMPLGSSLDNVNHLNYSFDVVKKPCVRPSGRH
ncbi:methyl-cpg-binding domain-containing protein 13 [Phtheirospermum japonicum]|uniref:Methyl-cpg-binding domain-containing protein 13 n=1 Tax=Phtheirospermum japonicum TaxID=374723 RepID=A0A830C052_9LAMI|nr:methyl-cpg-binding domain-containing protein 13 [Phtheirospermum japonicum]